MGKTKRKVEITTMSITFDVYQMISSHKQVGKRESLNSSLKRLLESLEKAKKWYSKNKGKVVFTYAKKDIDPEMFINTEDMAELRKILDPLQQESI